MSGIDLNDYEEFMVADFAPLNKPYTLTISGASVVKTFDRKTNDEISIPALHFRETKKKMKLTSSDNRRTLGRIYGSKSSGWIGKPIVVRVTEKKIFGEMKRFFVIDPVVPSAVSHQPSTSSGQPGAVQTPLTDPLDEMWRIATTLELDEPQAKINDMLTKCGNDATRALEVFKTQYAAVAGTGK